MYCSSLNLVIRTLLKDVEKLEHNRQLHVNDFTKIIKTVSSAPSYRHLILLESWKDFLIQNSEMMALQNIDDIEAAMENIDYRDPFLIEALTQRREEI